MNQEVRELRRKDPGDPVLRWEIHRPVRDPKVSVLIIHGYGEHRLRYAEVVRRWTEEGILVATFDLRGHGSSDGVRGHITHFGDYIRDLGELLDALDKDDTWRALDPPIVFGQSLGGLIATHLALAAPERVRGLLLSSPFFGLALEVPGAKRIAGQVMSRILPTFSLPTGLSGKDLTHDAAIASAYDTDPLGLKNATARWFTETMAAQTDAIARAPTLTTPIFCMHAGDDKIASVDVTEAFIAAAGSEEKFFRRLPGLFHEILNESDRAEWIGKYATIMSGWRPILRNAKTEH